MADTPADASPVSNRAAEIRTLAERQMGAFLKQMPNSKTGPKQLGSEAEPNSVPTIAEIGITKKQSATAQKLADIPAPEFRERLAVTWSGLAPGLEAVLRWPTQRAAVAFHDWGIHRAR